MSSKLLLFSFLLLIGVFPTPAPAHEIHGINVSLLVYNILQCESSLRHNVVGDQHLQYPAKGIAQFQERTFKYLQKKANKPELCWESAKDQIVLLKWAITRGYGSYWTCYRIVTKEGTR